MEMTGFEPVTSCLQSIYSTVELHPLLMFTHIDGLSWSKRIRTFESRYQKPTPYRLAILQKNPGTFMSNNGLEPLTFSL